MCIHARERNFAAESARREFTLTGTPNTLMPALAKIAPLNRGQLTDVESALMRLGEQCVASRA